MLLNRVAHFILIVVIGAVTLLVAQGAVDLNRLQNSTEPTTVVVSGLILNTGIGDGITAMFGGISETVEESLAETSEGIAVDGQ